MTKDEIYEHLARVYLGKKKKKKKAPGFKFYILLFLNIFAVIGIATLFLYGLKGTLPKGMLARNDIYFSLNQYPLRLQFNFQAPYPQIENFSLPLPEIDARPYRLLEFSIRATRMAAPAILRITLENKKKEMSSYFLKSVSTKWQKITIPLAEFKEITDRSNITKVHFVFEAWNIGTKKGAVLIDDICFSNEASRR